ncbi:MAG: TetR/AcrR family transcriptional regulator [Chloroflexota bacterium]
MPARKKEQIDLSTEDKIKNAARKVFSEKGYFGTRTRDIAEEAGINLALVNYYFRSKEKLFELVMQEKIYQLFGTIVPIMINSSMSFESKIDIIVDSYIDMLIENPDLPIFVFNEIKNNPQGFGLKLQAGPLMEESSFFKQLRERNTQIDPIHFILSFIGMMVFPFIARPVFTGFSNRSEESYKRLLLERKQYIPMWINAILNAKTPTIISE